MLSDRLLECSLNGYSPDRTRSIEVAIDPHEIVCAPPTASASELTQLIAERDVSCVAIIEESQTANSKEKPLKPVGILTARDLVKWHFHNCENPGAQGAIGSPLYCLSSTDTLAIADRQMQSLGVQYLGVCDDRGEWMGLVTPTSLLRAMDLGQFYPSEIEIEARKQESEELERRVGQLELEKIELLRDLEVEVERQVRERTIELQRQVDVLAESVRKRTQSQSAEMALKESEQKFRQLAENIREVFFIHDAKSFQAIYISPAFEEIWGFSSARVYENSFAWLDVVHPEDRDRVVAAAQQRGSKTAFEREYRIIRPDGEIRWIRERSFPVRDDSGAIYRLAGIAEDITERKLAQEALEQLNQQLETIVEQRTRLLKQTNERLQAQISERQQIESEIATRAKQQAIVAELGQQALLGTDLHLLVQQIVIQVAAGLGVDYCKMLEILPDARSLLTVGMQSDSEADGILLDREPLAQGSWEVDDLTQQPRFSHGDGSSSLSVAIQGTTSCFGVLGAYNHQPRTFTQDDIYFLQSAANVLAAAIERQQSQTALQESEAQYRRTIETAAEGIWMLDADRKTTFVNPRMAAMLGYGAEEILDRQMSDFMDDAPREIATEHFGQHDRKPSDRNDFKFRRQDGSTLWAIVSATPIFSPTGKYSGALMMLTDITDRKRAEAAIERQHLMSQLFAEIALKICRSLQLDDILQTTVTEVQKILDCDRVLIYRLLPDGLYVKAEALVPPHSALLDLYLPPEAFPGLPQQSYREGKVTAINDVEQTYCAYAPHIYELMQQWGVKAKLMVPILQQDTVWGFIIAHQCSTARQWTDFETELLEQLADRVGITVAQAQLLTARQESEARFRAMFEQAAVGIVQNDLDGRFIRCNQKSGAILGYPCEELLAKTLKEISDPEDLALERDSIEQLLCDDIQTFSVEQRFIRKNGSIVWVNITVSLVRTSLGKPDYFISVMEDVSDRKAALSERQQAQAKLEASLYEKEILLKEIHHRVKNNLYIISNLLDLQSETLEDDISKKLFADSQNRLQTMALIHEQLYKSTDLATIDFTEYVRNLVNNLYYSYNTTGGEIDVSIKADSLLVNLETAIPCGLLINELMTNSFKYAFPGETSGEITIQLYGDRDDKINLIVRDNGIGIPEEIDWQDTSSLGLRLVNILAEQLEGNIALDRQDGTSFHLVFRELKYEERF
ncbi:PAS domain S-box protein [Oscillatoriales cyanobacterium LEGE 11467]|uniref:PAS domain S-box protein n=1 Tax=Zarconia navalis LEGE 11467 TaxID=1828826 RepID=A0A928W1I9_9CYAN|nr:PAS domain S-box protein [Zarconia navalis]MBE9042271.1 PAS domain S-box protein [Zarconia navalis LEGE 11467]